MTEREQFEAAMSAYCDPARVEETFYREGDNYDAYATMFAWEAWQAARATPSDLTCKCRQLGDWKGFHHPLCDASRATPADRSVPVAGKDKWVAKVHVTHKGYSMELSKYIAYALPEGMHELYTQAPQPEAQIVRDAWIDCKVQMPPQKTGVLLAVAFDHPDDWRIKVGSFYDGAWHIHGASWFPTHWQPLPAPPQKPVSDEVKP